MNILVIGGTRNLGHFIVLDLLAGGHTVTLLNRGMHRDDLPPDLERLRADRTDAAALARVLAGRSFDAVVDNVIFKGDEAKHILALLDGRIGHYLFLSTGQVYLVREGLERPFKEDDYPGRLMPAPKPNTYAHEEWLYGVEKRDVEDAFAAAPGFPYTSLRIPMVNGERDHHRRLVNYYCRLRDGAPLLIPETPDHPLRHVYSGDVAHAVRRILELGQGKGRAFNLSQEETVSLEDFLGIVAGYMGVRPRLMRVKRSLLEANGFLPDCSPFSERWMSELDNTRSKTELGISYTPLRDYLRRIVESYEQTPPAAPPGYRRRRAERDFAGV